MNTNVNYFLGKILLAILVTLKIKLKFKLNNKEKQKLIVKIHEKMINIYIYMRLLLSSYLQRKEFNMNVCM